MILTKRIYEPEAQRMTLGFSLQNTILVELGGINILNGQGTYHQVLNYYADTKTKNSDVPRVLLADSYTELQTLGYLRICAFLLQAARLVQ